MTKSFIIAGFAALSGITAFGRADKYIAAGWEFAAATADTLMWRADAMDKMAMDGCVLYINSKGTDNTTITSRNIIHQRAWTDADLAPDIPKYRKLLAHKAFRYSFLNSYRAPTNRVAWTDDATWAKVANNMRVAAKFAKACGFYGMQMDPEDYHKQNQYLLLESDGMNYETAAKLARERGRQVFRGVFEEFPDVHLLSYWFLTMGNLYVADIHGKYLRDIMNRAATDLWPHFVEGILDVLSPEAKLIDGLETAYNWEASAHKYYNAANIVRHSLSLMVSPENQEKYRRQMQVSFGVYLDGYSNITNVNDVWYMAPKNGSRLNHLVENLRQATDAADDIIWLWCEKGSWTGSRDPVIKTTWEEQLPGVNDALTLVKNPEGLGRKLRARMDAGELKSINENVQCVSTDASKVPSEYWTWAEDPKYHLRPGKFSCDLTQGDGDSCSLMAEGCQRGSFNLSVKDKHYKPGEVFGLSFSSKGKHVSVEVGWTKNGK